MMNGGKTANVVSGEASFGTVFDMIKPVYVEFSNVSVGISAKTEVALAFIRSFCIAVQDKLVLDSSNGLPVSLEEISAYLEYACFARVVQVDGTQQKGELLWKRYDNFFVPSFLAVFLAQVGIVERADLGLRLTPTWKGDVPKITRDQLMRVSNLMRLLEDHGFEMMKGLPKGSDGSWSMMSMELIEGHVHNTTPEHHPSFAVMAAFFGVAGLAQVLSSSAFRIRYVSTAQAATYGWEVTHGAKGRA